jgi:hypothetical protein
VNNVHYAAFYAKATVDFIAIDHLQEYLLTAKKSNVENP